MLARGEGLISPAVSGHVICVASTYSSPGAISGEDLDAMRMSMDGFWRRLPPSVTWLAVIWAYEMVLAEHSSNAWVACSWTVIGSLVYKC